MTDEHPDLFGGTSPLSSKSKKRAKRVCDKQTPMPSVTQHRRVRVRVAEFTKECLRWLVDRFKSGANRGVEWGIAWHVKIIIGPGLLALTIWLIGWSETFVSDLEDPKLSPPATTEPEQESSEPGQDLFKFHTTVTYGPQNDQTDDGVPRTLSK